MFTGTVDDRIDVYTVAPDGSHRQTLTNARDGGAGAAGSYSPNGRWRRWREAGSPPAGARPGEGETVAWDESSEPFVRYDFSDPWAGDTGDVEATALHAGQSVGLVREVLPAAEIVAQLVEEAEAALHSARTLLECNQCAGWVVVDVLDEPAANGQRILLIQSPDGTQETLVTPQVAMFGLEPDE